MEKQNIKEVRVYVDSLEQLMREHERYPELLFGETRDGESVTMSVCADCVITETLQKNGWTRINTYWIDGTQEETFKR